jgi:photosystem II stability/assembly factor-like uncharacterized protein
MSVTFVSAQTGFVLGQLPCAAKVCYGLATTTDAGRTWSFGGDLPMAPQQDQPITKVRFADATNGWAFGPQLWSTHDAGKSWHQLTATSQVFDVEASAGLVYLLGSSCGAGTACATPAKLFRAAVGSDSFAAVPGATMTATAGQLALHGKAVWVVGATPGTAFVSSSDGASWRKHASPCPQGAGPSSLTGVAPVTSTTVFLLCASDPGAGSESKLVLWSTDGGSTAHQTAAAPDRGGLASGFAAASASVVAVSAQSGATYIYLSRDAGATWASPFTNGDGGVGITDLGFTTPTQGVAIYGTPGNGQLSQLLMSRDAGASWAAATF